MNKKKGIILFVDDEYYVLQTLKAILRRDFTDHELLFAQNGKEAIELLASIPEIQETRLLVFSDWLMPGIKGDDLLVQIADLYPHCTNFLLSGMINREPPQDIFQRARIEKIIEKPWDNQSLISLIKSHL